MTTNPSPPRFESFMQGFAAAVLLKRRAAENGCFIECVCLSTSIVDGLLRIGLILNSQLQTRSDKIIEELLYQPDPGKIVTEREIYKRALHENIITQTVYEELNDLHDQRNRIVHRYIISDITTDQVLQIAERFDVVVDTVNQSVRKLEDEQLRRGVGMTRGPKDLSESLRGRVGETIQQMADTKHGNPNLARNLRTNRKKGAS